MSVWVLVMPDSPIIRSVTTSARSSYCFRCKTATRSYSPVTEYTSATPGISRSSCAVRLISPRRTLINTSAVIILFPFAPRWRIHSPLTTSPSDALSTRGEGRGEVGTTGCASVFAELRNGGQVRREAHHPQFLAQRVESELRCFMRVATICQNRWNHLRCRRQRLPDHRRVATHHRFHQPPIARILLSHPAQKAHAKKHMPRFIPRHRCKSGAEAWQHLHLTVRIQHTTLPGQCHSAFDQDMIDRHRLDQRLQIARLALHPAGRLRQHFQQHGCRRGTHKRARLRQHIFQPLARQRDHLSEKALEEDHMARLVNKLRRQKDALGFPRHGCANWRQRIGHAGLAHKKGRLPGQAQWAHIWCHQRCPLGLILREINVIGAPLLALPALIEFLRRWQARLFFIDNRQHIFYRRLGQLPQRQGANLLSRATHAYPFLRSAASRAASSRSSRRSTLPVIFLGSSVRNSTRRGHLKTAIPFRQ